MSHLQIKIVPGRVVLVHDMGDQAVISELELDQASLLLRQLGDAVHRARALDAIPA